MAIYFSPCSVQGEGDEHILGGCGADHRPLLLLLFVFIYISFIPRAPGGHLHNRHLTAFEKIKRQWPVDIDLLRAFQGLSLLLHFNIQNTGCGHRYSLFRAQWRICGTDQNCPVCDELL